MILIAAQAFPPQTGGIQNLLAGTAEYIARAGYDVVVLADGGAEARAWDRNADRPYVVERFSGPRPFRRRMKFHRLLKHVKQDNVKALYADTWKSLELFDRKFNFPIVTWAHGNEFPRADMKARRIKNALSKADHIIFNSRDTKQRAEAFTPDQMPFSIVNPPVFDPAWDTGNDGPVIEKLWASKGPRLLSFCRLINWKGIDQAIKALPNVLKSFPDARYLVAGVGDDRKRLESLTDSLGLQDHISFLGWIEGSMKTALFKSADIFLQPGRQVVEEREGYGISYVEAALQGLPTICGNAGGAPEAVVHNKTGIVVDATVTIHVGNAIVSILSDKKRHQAMRIASKKHGETCLWNNQVTHVLDAAGLASQSS